MTNCIFCKKIPEMLSEKNPFVVHEFKNSVLIVGDHQTFPGYCVLVLKEHAKELFDLDPLTQIEFYQELAASSQAVKATFFAEKVNVASYGNVTPHLHWHIFPRKTSDSNWPQPPWSLMKSFEKYKTSLEQAQKVTTLLSEFFSKKKS